MPQQVQSLNSSFSPRSPRENVNHGGQESQRTHVRQNILLNVQSEDVAGIWTKVPGNRTPRSNNRKKALNQFEDKFITPSPPVTVKGFIPSLTTERKGSFHFKAFAQVRPAEYAKSQQEFAALQTQVVSLTTTLNSVLAMLQTLTKTIKPQEQSMKGDTPQILLSPLSSPISKVSFKDALGSKTPSPTKSDGGKSTISSNHDDSTASSSRESAAAGSKHDGTTTSSPSCDGSLKGKFSASLKRSPPVVTPATVDKRSIPNPSPSTPPSAPAPAPAPVVATKKAKKLKPRSIPAVTAKKVMSRPSPPLTTPPSRDNLGNKTRKFNSKYFYFRSPQDLPVSP